MNILLTGACGYVGSSLTPYLLSKGHKINAIDIQWFGNYLDEHPNLKLHKKDIRDLEESDFTGIDTVIHLANIANDPGVELNPTLSWEVNVLATQHLADLANRNGIRQFIYASSGSVYGVKEEKHVTEELSLVPISVYNKTKMVSERVLLSYTDTMKIHNIRPATVCGYSPRMRLDVSVNMLAFQAFKNKKITVFGGDQVRPNIHITDMVRVYNHFIDKGQEIESGNYNAGFENISILQIAEMIVSKLPAEIIVTESNDPRSYRQNSDKLIATNFNKSYSVENAIDELISKFQSGEVQEKDEFFTVKWMKTINLDK
jgi:nucleoside-diphosphate-sugar epimerase|tara:strand:- start:970 stop:1917 length:948 start_codon:yes stop_codon:yes gene_type:complete